MALKSRLLTSTEAAVKCHAGKESICRFLGYGPDGFQCFLMIESMRREADRRAAAGLSAAIGAACADPYDGTSETDKQLDGCVVVHDPGIQYIVTERLWAVYCTCGWRVNVLAGVYVDILVRQRKEQTARRVGYDHLVEVGMTEQAKHYADYYRVRF